MFPVDARELRRPCFSAFLFFIFLFFIFIFYSSSFSRSHNTSFDGLVNSPLFTPTHRPHRGRGRLRRSRLRNRGSVSTVHHRPLSDASVRALSNPALRVKVSPDHRTYPSPLLLPLIPLLLLVVIVVVDLVVSNFRRCLLAVLAVLRPAPFLQRRYHNARSSSFPIRRHVFNSLTAPPTEHTGDSTCHLPEPRAVRAAGFAGTGVSC